MSTNWDIIVAAIEAAGCPVKKENNGWYRSNRPWSANSQSKGLRMKPNADGMTGGFHDKVSDEKGNFYTLADKLGVELVKDHRPDVGQSLRKYETFKDYAESHGLTTEYMQRAGWEYVESYTDFDFDGKKFPRPALLYTTDTGKRVRFLDGKKPKYKPANKLYDKSFESYKDSWYLLDRAIAVANMGNIGNLYICNGATSVLAAQRHSVPATSLNQGESEIPEHLLEEITKKWSGAFVVALDCDESGREASIKIKAQFERLKRKCTVIDMGLSKGGDLADLARLHTKDTHDHLLELVIESKDLDEQLEDDTHMSDAHTFSSVADRLLARYEGDLPIEQIAVPFPLEAFHRFGGFAANLSTQKITLIIGGSGYGKTMFMEHICDEMSIQGYNSLWWGGEWTEEEMAMRRVERWSQAPQVTYQQQQDHLTWRSYEDRGLTGWQNKGKRMDDNQMTEVRNWLTQFKELDGQPEYFKGSDVLGTTLNKMRNALTRQRAKGRDVWVVFFDYAQLIKTEQYSSDAEKAFAMIKDFAGEMNVHVIMTSQITKNASSANKDGHAIKTEAAQNLRPDRANMVLVMNRQFKIVEFVDGLGNKSIKHQETDAFWIDIGKLSYGGSKEHRRVAYTMVPERLTFEPRDWTKDPEYHYLKDCKYFGQPLTAKNLAS